MFIKEFVLFLCYNFFPKGFWFQHRSSEGTLPSDRSTGSLLHVSSAQFGPIYSTSLNAIWLKDKGHKIRVFFSILLLSLIWPFPLLASFLNFIFPSWVIGIIQLIDLQFKIQVLTVIQTQLAQTECRRSTGCAVTTPNYIAALIRRLTLN